MVTPRCEISLKNKFVAPKVRGNRGGKELHVPWEDVALREEHFSECAIKYLVIWTMRSRRGFEGTWTEAPEKVELSNAIAVGVPLREEELEVESKIGGRLAASMWIHKGRHLRSHGIVFKNQKKLSCGNRCLGVLREQENHKWIFELSLALEEHSVLEAMRSAHACSGAVVVFHITLSNELLKRWRYLRNYNTVIGGLFLLTRTRTPIPLFHGAQLAIDIIVVSVKSACIAFKRPPSQKEEQQYFEKRSWSTKVRRGQTDGR